MPMMLGDLKSKYIVHEGQNFRPWLEFCGFPPYPLELCETIHQAQVILRQYPPDCWDGYLSQQDELNHHGYII